MSENRIFVRTSLGQAELAKPDGNISVDGKRLMLFLDGQSTVEHLRQKAPVSVRQNLDYLLNRLLLKKFIVDIRYASSHDLISQSERPAVPEEAKSMTASQVLHLEMLLLAEVEVERRVAAEQELAETQAKLMQSQHNLQEVTNKYERVKGKILLYKQGVETTIAQQQAQIAAITGTNQGDRTQRIKLETDLLRLRADLEVTQNMVEKKSAALDETLRQRIAIAQSAELEKRKQLKIAAEERVRDHPQYVRIRGLEFFKKFRNSDLAELLSWAQWMPVKAGETVIEEGELGLPFYVIVSGRLAAIKNSHVLTLLHAGESFGELAYLDDENPQRGASVVAKTDCELLMLEPIHLESAELMLRMHIAEALVRIQAKRLRRAMNVVAKVLENKKQGNHNETN